MLDIGWPELFVILVVALLVIGPKDLPRALSTVGKWMRAARKVTSDFQRHVDDMMRETELDEVRKGIQKAQGLNVKKQIENTIDPGGDLRSAFDPSGGSKDKAAKPAPEATAPKPAQAASEPVSAPAKPVAAAPPPSPESPPRSGLRSDPGDAVAEPEPVDAADKRA